MGRVVRARLFLFSFFFHISLEKAMDVTYIVNASLCAAQMLTITHFAPHGKHVIKSIN